jgi:predicted outer membrane repeat protein
MRFPFGIVLSVPVYFLTMPAAAATHHVPEQYATIQAAIDASMAGDSILVAQGDYQESLVISSKSLSIFAVPGDSVRVYGLDHSENRLTITGAPGDVVFVRDISFEKGKRIIYCIGASLILHGCILKDASTTYWGAGLYCEGAFQLLIENCLIEDCWSLEGENQGGGGGMYLTNLTSVLIRNSRIEDNVATDQFRTGDRGSANGGGINAHDIDFLTLLNCSVSENSAYGYGGGIFCHCDHLILKNCVFAGNSAYSNGKAMYIRSSASGLLINSIVTSENTASLIQVHSYSVPLEVSFCNIADSISSVWGPCSWGSGNLDEDPMFEAGPFGEYHLSVPSPCIDAGDPALTYNDPEDPDHPGFALWPAMGLMRNDMGMFGGAGCGDWVSVMETDLRLSTGNLLLACRPNPALGHATISVGLPTPTEARLLVYDMAGRLVRTVFSGCITDSRTDWLLDAESLPAGIYTILLVAEQQIRLLRIALL